MEEKNLNTILESLAEYISSLKVEIMIKDHRIEALDNEVKALKEIIKNA